MPLCPFYAPLCPVPREQIKLKNLIIACFIPPDYQDKIMQHCHWQDYDSTWSIDCIAYAGTVPWRPGRAWRLLGGPPLCWH